MNGVTVRELAAYCNDLIKRGLGDKVVLITSDDEGNEYHTLYYHFSTDADEIKQIADCGIFHDNNNPEDVVLLG